MKLFRDEPRVNVRGPSWGRSAIALLSNTRIILILGLGVSQSDLHNSPSFAPPHLPHQNWSRELALVAVSFPGHKIIHRCWWWFLQLVCAHYIYIYIHMSCINMPLYTNISYIFSRPHLSNIIYHISFVNHNNPIVILYIKSKTM